MLKNRRYASGSAWAVWRWKDILFDGVLYLSRLHILHTPLGGVMLHWILSADPQRDLHDHPTNFVAVVVSGGYVEDVPGGTRTIRWVNVKRSTDFHRIVSVRQGTITLVFYGRRMREWGFKAQQGWVLWRDYQAKGEWR